MIKVKRGDVPAPAALTGPNCKGATELAKNQSFAKAKTPKSMSFNAYKDPSVRHALKKLFFGKCAYCESFMAGQQPGDIEHYRPKANVWITNRRTGRVVVIPGYYWLAAEWQNLLPACADCNRPREHFIIGVGGKVAGKANLFPIADERKRAKSPKRVALEARLLLDPCEDDPEKHLDFQVDGTIKPRKVKGSLSAMGRSTIETCALMREGLVQAKARLNISLEAFSRLALQDMAAGRMINPLVTETLEELMSRESEFSAHARQFVSRKLRPYWDKVKHRHRAK